MWIRSPFSQFFVIFNRKYKTKSIKNLQEKRTLLRCTSKGIASHGSGMGLG